MQPNMKDAQFLILRKEFHTLRKLACSVSHQKYNKTNEKNMAHTKTTQGNQ